MGLIVKSSGIILTNVVGGNAVRWTLRDSMRLSTYNITPLVWRHPFKLSATERLEVGEIFYAIGDNAALWTINISWFDARDDEIISDLNVCIEIQTSAAERCVLGLGFDSRDKIRKQNCLFCWKFNY